MCLTIKTSEGSKETRLPQRVLWISPASTVTRTAGTRMSVRSVAVCTVPSSDMRVGELLKIALVDHVIIGRPSPDHAPPGVSLRALGYLA